uniref:Uncharacterized protein n=1 Tax=Brassica oleracea TaxID=3712 RepID=A0A3P6EEJ9_BRAOL|nr:unnamed protein product [Brassica oleracea]
MITVPSSHLSIVGGAKNEQKWLSTFGTDNDKSKKRKGEDGSQASVHSSSHGVQEETSSQGVKKAKARLKAKRDGSYQHQTRWRNCMSCLR